MKRYIQYLVVIIFLMASHACSESYLDLVPENAVSAETLDADLALTGCYNALQEDYIFRLRSWNDASLRERECFTDNSMNAYLWQRFNNLKQGSLTAANNVPNRRPWIALYSGILQTNETLSRVPELEELSDEEVNLVIAQAQVIRAYLYWQLIVAWDDVPFPTTPTSLDQKFVGKSTAREIYDALVPELEAAASLLPEVWPADEFGRVTAHAANALLARMHLFFYGYHNVADGAQKASEAAGRIINSGAFDLYEDYESLFTPENEMDNEIVWSIRFAGDLGGNNGESISYSTTTRPYPNNMPLPNLVDDFYCTDGLPIDQSPLYNPDSIQLNRDPRLDATVVFPGEQWLSDFPAFDIGPANRRTGFAVDKYCMSARGNAIQGNGNQDFYVFRYADVLLMRAEALVETGNTGQEVYDLVNEVRERVNMPPIEDVAGTGLSAAALMDIIRHERRVELAFEDTRFADLKRWGTMEEAYERSAGDTKFGTNALILSGVQYQGDRSIILPLPQDEIDDNNLLEQHPAWQ